MEIWTSFILGEEASPEASPIVIIDHSIPNTLNIDKGAVTSNHVMTLTQGHAFPAIPGYTEEETQEIYHEVLSVLCTPMKIGSHYEGTSTNDVTFWVLHPTFDRCKS